VAACNRGRRDQGNPRAKTILLEVPGWPGHSAGQHVDVRLTAEDGYQTERSYSIASAPEDARLALTVERLDDGEVSPYLTGELGVGDELELRGPMGGYFTWRARDGGPLLPDRRRLGAGAADGDAAPSHRQRQHGRRAAAGLRTLPRRRLLSRRARELGSRRRAHRPAHIHREAPAVGPAPTRRPRIFVCGPTAFVERAADLLITLGHEPATIRTERFGPTGG
jgi:ferredoxin-NADP reductase